MTAAGFSSTRCGFFKPIPPGVLIWTLLLLTWIFVALFACPHAPQAAHLAAQSIPWSSLRSPKLLIVVFSIPNPNAKQARESHEAYAARHGYDYREMNIYIGNDTRGHRHRAVSLQKLLACTLTTNHDYVLVLDRDVIIAPWAPPIHVVARTLGSKVGIVDENQPRKNTPARVVQLRTAMKQGVPLDRIALGTPRDYYRGYGFDIEASEVLNTGVMLFQPKHHGEFLKKLYYHHVEKQKKSKALFHYEQAMLGSELIAKNMYKKLPHAWNRIWVWYNWSSAVGEPAYTLPQVFQRSYFLHFCWMKDDMKKLDNWRKKNRVSFAPAPYATDALP